MNRDFNPQDLRTILDYPYDILELREIRNFFYRGGSIYDAPKFIRQILAKMGVLTSKENEYRKAFMYLTKKFDLGCDVLELGGGHYPILSEYIDEYQRKIGKGTITVMDPKLVVPKLGNIKLQKGYFDKSTDISKYQLVVALSPDDMFETIVSKCAQQDIEYFVSLCNCITTKYRQKMLEKGMMSYDFYEDYDPTWDTILRDVESKDTLITRGKSEASICLTNLAYCRCETGNPILDDEDDLIKCLVRRK